MPDEAPVELPGRAPFLAADAERQAIQRKALVQAINLDPVSFRKPNVAQQRFYNAIRNPKYESLTNGER